MSKSAVRNIIDTLGSEAIQRAVNVGPHSVRSARTNGQFPAAWFASLDAMCAEAGIECPRDAFAFKTSTAA